MSNGINVPLTERMGQSSAPGKPLRPVHGVGSRGLPASFIERLLEDSEGDGEYRRIHSIADIDNALPSNASYCEYMCCGCFCYNTTLVNDSSFGLMQQDAEDLFLGPGYHKYRSCGNQITGTVSTRTVDTAITNGSIGFITVSEGKVAVMLVGAHYKLLAPGMYRWNSPRVQILNVVSIRQDIIELGPYRLVTVPVGQVAVTFYNGDLRILGGETSGGNAGGPAYDVEPAATFQSRGANGSPATGTQRTYFLDDPKWVLRGFLPTVMQTDRLEGNDLLSKDNVEVLMVAMAQWRIIDPVRAVTHCAPDMDNIRTKVDQLVRATIARIVAGTHIGAGPVSGHMSQPVVRAVAAADADCAAAPVATDEDDLSHMMQTDAAIRHMAELKMQMDFMGIEVAGVYVPEKSLKDDNIRSQIAKQAVIGIRADAERSAADATAYATVKAARAQAEAILLLANAHSEAGQRLGAPETTAARLALSETVAKALENSNVTLFSGAPSTMPFMFSAPPSGGSAKKKSGESEA